jgi:hypothetical protein
MDIKYVIPSYNRVDILRTHTLAFLQRNTVKVSDIFIFVVREQYDIYKEAYPEYNIIIGRVGLKEQRNFITDYFSIGDYIVSLDDDIKDIIMLVDGMFISLNNFQEVVIKGFAVCVKENCSLFGFYPVLNKDWMKDTISTDFKFIIGSCFGYINRKIVRTISEKDDYLFSVLNYIRDKKVIRYNFISIKTKYYKQSGGLQSFSNRKELQQEAVLYLIDKYPEYFALKKSFKSGFPELRVKQLKNLPEII